MILDRITPSAEQERAIAQMLLEAGMSGGALNASDMGTGKTVMAVEVALRLQARTVLISAPLHTRFGWQDTILRQTAGAAVVRFVDNKTKAGKAALLALRTGEPAFYIMGRELFRLTKWDKVKVDMVVHDECHSLANRNSKGFDVALDLRKRTKYTICQSATWYGTNFSGAWGIGRVLFPDDVPKAFWKFVADYCATERNRFADRPDPEDPTKTIQGKKVVAERTPGAFASSLPCYINIKAKASDPPLVQSVYVDLSPKQRRLYDQFEKDGIAWLDSHPLVAEVPAVQRIRLRQLTLAECTVTETDQINPKTGAAIVDVTFEHGAKSSKLEALQEMLADMPDEQVLIATDSAKFARLVADELGRDVAYPWTGAEPQAARDLAKQWFIEGKLPYLVATQAAISEGTDGLQRAAHIIIELSQNDSPLLNSQLIGRLHRRGQKQRVLVYRILARKTLDDEQNESLLMKAQRMRQSMLKEEVPA